MARAEAGEALREVAAVPEVAVAEDCDAGAVEHDVGAAWEGADVDTVAAEAGVPERAAEQELGLGVALATRSLRGA